MNYAILRLEKRTLGQGLAMARHALRAEPTPNADPAKTHLNTVLGPATPNGVRDLLKTRTAPLMKRKDAVRCVELFIGGSNEAITAMTRTQQDRYFDEARLWVIKLFGDDPANVVMWIVHRDETTPHVQCLLTPIVAGKLAANTVIGGPGGMVKLQDRFAADVGQKFGLRRGEKGSQAKHTSVRSFYAAIKAAGSADALPQRVLVPPEPEPLGFFAGSAAKEAHEAAKAAREAALKHNREVQDEIARLARLALATHGRGRRQLPAQLSHAEATIEAAKKAQFEIRIERDRLAQERAKVDKLRAEVPMLMLQRDGLTKQIEGMTAPVSTEKGDENDEASTGGENAVGTVDRDT